MGCYLPLLVLFEAPVSNEESGCTSVGSAQLTSRAGFPSRILGSENWGKALNLSEVLFISVEMGNYLKCYNERCEHLFWHNAHKTLSSRPGT